MVRSNKSVRRAAGIGLMLGGLVLASCGGGAGGSSSTPTAAAVNVSVQPSIASEVPSAIKSSAPIQIASDATYAPNEFVDPNTGDIIGWDIDFAKAICHVWGITCTINNVTFADIIPALLESPPKYVLSFSSYTPTAAREAKGIDFVTYYQAGESWLEKPGGASITQASDMCGHSVAVESGTTEESDAYGYMGQMPGGGAISGDTDHCKAAGKPDITVESFDTQTEADAALLSGRADYGWADTPVAYYQLKLESGKLKIGGQVCGLGPYGIAMTHGSGLQKATEDAITYLIDHGYYKQILAQWNAQAGAIPSSDVGVNINSSTGAGSQSCVPSY